MASLAYPLSLRSGGTEGGQIEVSFSIPTARAFAEVHRLLIRHLFGLGLVTGLTLAATQAFGHRYFLRQAYAPICATQRLTAGVLSARTGVLPGPVELVHLATVFDDMAQTFQPRQETLQASEERFGLRVDGVKDYAIVMLDVRGRIWGESTPDRGTTFHWALDADHD